MKGWKTRLAGIGTMLLGAGQLAKAVSDGDWQAGQQAFQVFMAGLAIIGIGHKIDKVSG